MSTVNAEEPEYESDPEELKHSLARRRREASDDDDDEQGTNQRPVIDSESEEEDSYDEEEEEEEGIEKEKVSNVVKEGEEEEEEKEKKQSTVPTGGAFYMHDDRFQESSGGRSRGRRGGRVWGSGDERRWGHDKFEEVNTNTNEQRGFRGRFRGRGNGRGRGQERGYGRGGSSSRGQQVYLPKDVTRGRGGQRKDDVVSVGNVNQAQRKQSRNWQEKGSQFDSRRLGTASTKTGNDDVKKNVVASSLSSASRPFYPSESASNLVHGIQVGMERLHTNERHAPSGQKYSRNTKAPVSTAPAAGNALYPQSHNHGDRFSSSPMQFNGGSKGTGQSRYRPTGQGSAVGRSLSSSPRKTSTSRNRYFPDEIGETGAKGKGALQPSGSGSYMYVESQVMGRADRLASGDSSNYPAYLPVMQFGAQHGGVPTIGMAFPGYYQSENGVGSPEMAWMPVLTGPGALGASYSPPYAAIDGSYQAHKPGLSSSAGSSSRENSTNNLNDLEKSMERPDATESGVQQRQNNNPSKHPRRYSEMSFSK